MHSHTRAAFDVLSTVFALLVAIAALLTFTRRRHRMFHAAALPVSPVAPQALIAEAPASTAPESDVHPRRFIAGVAFGVGAGVVLGVAGAIAVSVANPDVRSAVIVGTGLRPAPASTDGEYVGRVIGQALNPNLAYADDAGVAALLAQQPEVEPEARVALTPVEEDLRDNAPLVFAVLGVLTMVSWSGIMWGLTRSAPALSGAVVE